MCKYLLRDRVLFADSELPKCRWPPTLPKEKRILCDYGHTLITRKDSQQHLLRRPGTLETNFRFCGAVRKRNEQIYL